MKTLVFDFPAAWQVGAPLALGVLVLSALAQRRRGLLAWRIAVLTALRALTFLALIFLAAKPTWVTREPPPTLNRPVALLIDRSESMSLQEGDRTRHSQALEFARDHLLPALKDAALPVHGLVFAEDAEVADGVKLNTTPPTGRRTNLGRAIARAVGASTNPPLAVIALTDGLANEPADNARGLSALLENRVPFIGVGFGSDTGVQTLTLRRLEAPHSVSTNTLFRVAAELEMVTGEDLPAFELVLLRDGKAVQKRSVQPGRGSRLWLESFPVSERQEGAHTYAIHLFPPPTPNLKCLNTSAATAVTVTDERELRVLYVQGALTWDYKFVALALKGDPSVKLTGLTRTSKHSVFRQNVETASELQSGFPTSPEEIAPFRVIVLASLTPADLSPSQQELLARFCTEFGGGVLLIGGPATFHVAWQGSRLEQLLPVAFAGNPGVQGLDRPFRLRLTEEALREPLFQVAHDRSVREVWSQIPTFSQYSRVDAPKPGAQVWAVHPDDDGPKGKRILMAAQRCGAGLSAVLCVQNFWRWRLAKDADPQHFDRFWRQLLRFLGEASRQEVMIHLADQDLSPGREVRLVLERRPKAADPPDAKPKFLVRVEDEQKKVVREQAIELPANRPAELRFPGEKAGLYTVTVRDAQQAPVAGRTVELREENLEFRETARNLETLRQWASLSEGLALKAEECGDAHALVAQIRGKVEQVRRSRPQRRPAGINGWLLTAVLGSLGAEWLFRKRWLLP
jgi:hypothetical protein